MKEHIINTIIITLVINFLLWIFDYVECIEIPLIGFLMSLIFVPIAVFYFLMVRFLYQVARRLEWRLDLQEETHQEKLDTFYPYTTKNLKSIYRTGRTYRDCLCNNAEH